MKNWKRMKKKIAQIGICVKGPTLCTNEWQKSAYNRPVCTSVWCSRAFRFWTGRGAFSLFYTRTDGWTDGRTDGCIDRPDTITRASFLRVFFSLVPCAPTLETHFYSGQFRRLLLTFLSRDRRTFYLACARTPRRRLCDTFFILYEFFPPRTHTSYHAPLTTAMSIIRIFRHSSRVAELLYPRSCRSTVSLVLQLAKYVTTRLLSCTLNNWAIV